MKRLHVIMFVCFVSLGVTTAPAQQKHLVLQFEITKDGTLIATPELLLQPGSVGRIDMDSDDAPNAPLVKGMHERIALTPTVQGDNLSIAFEITSAGKRFQPSLAISKDVKGAFEWVNGESQAIRMTVSWLD